MLKTKIHLNLLVVLLVLFHQPAFSSLTAAEFKSAQELLRQSLHFYNDAFRDPQSGQYLDAISLQRGAVRETNSSIASTGMGLVSLALGDATGDIAQAQVLAVQTLSRLLNPAYSKRSSAGWFRHWFNAHDGSDNSMSRADGYSTVDTAILAAGAVLSANYFRERKKDPKNSLQIVANRLLQSVRWASAISDADLGKLYLNYDLQTEKPQLSTSKFNEYILVACMGKLAEEKRGEFGPMSRFWRRHYAQTSLLPKKIFRTKSESIELLTDYPLYFLSSFTIQFAYYLCGDVNSSPDYRRYFKNAMRADRAWFRQQSINRTGYWGLGAGQALNDQYAANAISKNPDLIVSPHIIAGFIPAAPEVLRDLLRLQKDNLCTYSYGEHKFLWRCTLLDFNNRLDRVQSIDFSSMFLGLAVLHPSVGGSFYRTYSP
ncbi:MAG: hypothetical protein ACK5UJ_04935 [Pseudobdellovibrionaceae bacterium]